MVEKRCEHRQGNLGSPIWIRLEWTSCVIILYGATKIKWIYSILPNGAEWKDREMVKDVWTRLLIIFDGESEQAMHTLIQWEVKVKVRAVKIAKVCSFADVLHELGDVRKLVVTCIERRIDRLS